MRIIVSIPAELLDAERKTAGDWLKKYGWTEVAIGRPGPTFSHAKLTTVAKPRSRRHAVKSSSDLFHIESYQDD